MSSGNAGSKKTARRSTPLTKNLNSNQKHQKQNTERVNFESKTNPSLDGLELGGVDGKGKCAAKVVVKCQKTSCYLGAIFYYLTLTKCFIYNFAESFLAHCFFSAVPYYLITNELSGSFFGTWNEQAQFGLVLFLVCIVWTELFASGHGVVDAAEGWVSFSIERNAAKFGYHKRPFRDEAIMRCISGILAAVCVGSFYFSMSPINPFGSKASMMAELKDNLKSTAGPSLVYDVFKSSTGEVQRDRYIEMARHGLLSGLTSIIPMTDYMPWTKPLLSQGVEALISSRQLESDYILRAFSLLSDIWITEWLCSFFNYMVLGIFTYVSCFFDIGICRVFQIGLSMLFIAVGLPYTTMISGPMQSLSYAAMVAAGRQDLLMFLWVGSATVTASFAARYLLKSITIVSGGKTSQKLAAVDTETVQDNTNNSQIDQQKKNK